VTAFRLPFRAPLDPSNLYGHLAATAVPGVEEWVDGTYRAAVRLSGGPATIAVGLPEGDSVPVRVSLASRGDEDEALARVRRTFDLDLDPAAMGAVLSEDPALRPLVAGAPGRRVPGTLDPEAMVLRAVLGQQVSTAAARTHTARLVAAFGAVLPSPDGGLTHLFPRAEDLVAAPERVAEVVRMPRTRIRTLLAVAGALADGSVDLRAPAADVRVALLALPGIGPWTADYIALRALGDPDVFLPADTGTRDALTLLGRDPASATDLAHAWRPWRSYAQVHLWRTLTPTYPEEH